MNAGLSNLATLKAHLLPNTMAADTTFDDVLLDLGKGVAGALEKWCNRKFARTEGDTAQFSGDRDHFHLPRFPVETVTSVHVKTSEDEGWVAQSGAIQNRDDSIGWIYFGSYLTDYTGLVRVTYTGGYWFDTSEDESGEMPAAATALPDPIKWAWLAQCRATWQAIDKLGTSLTSDRAVSLVSASLFGMEIIPLVKSHLEPFRRFEIT